VKFAEPTDYVWDCENDYVQENGHPAVTPLEQAKKEKNMEGWKENDVTAFEADYGENPASDYTDNVVFPSGKKDPPTTRERGGGFGAAKLGGIVSRYFHFANTSYRWFYNPPVSTLRLADSPLWSHVVDPHMGAFGFGYCAGTPLAGGGFLLLCIIDFGGIETATVSSDNYNYDLSTVI